MKVTPVDFISIATTSASKLQSKSHRYRIKNRNRNHTVVPFLLLCLRCCCVIFATSTIRSITTTTNVLLVVSAMSSPTKAAATEAAKVAKSTIDFLTMARGLKTTPRTGWIRQKAGPRIESVADHSWRISLMAMVASSSASASASTTSSDSYDTNKCIKIAMVHDLAEATVGDITPHCGVSDVTKHDLELEAITSMTSQLAMGFGASASSSSSTTSTATSAVGAEILELWKEYEAGDTPEAKLVKDMDKLEMILQALEYETDGKNEESLDGFFDSTRGKWRTPIGKAWGEEIESRRPKNNGKGKAQTTLEEGTES